MFPLTLWERTQCIADICACRAGKRQLSQETRVQIVQVKCSIHGPSSRNIYKYISLILHVLLHLLTLAMAVIVSIYIYIIYGNDECASQVPFHHWRAPGAQSGRPSLLDDPGGAALGGITPTLGRDQHSKQTLLKPFAEAQRWRLKSMTVI